MIKKKSWLIEIEWNDINQYGDSPSIDIGKVLESIDKKLLTKFNISEQE